MVKKLNHKIFNLIIMIFISIFLLSILNISHAQEKTIIYGQEEEIKADYVPEEEEEVLTDEDKFWLRANNNNLFQQVRANVAQWYYIFRYLCIAVMLVILLVLGIKLALASLAEQKATYKRMLLDWVVCFILLFMVHYFMIFVQFLNERLVYIFQNISNQINTNGEYSLYETVRSRAYDMKFTVGFTGMALYMALVWITAKYVVIYAKRFITMVILTIMAPILVLFYGLQKIFTGKSKTLAKWMGEYLTNTIMQAVHAMTYSVFVGLALKLSQESLVGVILSYVFLNFMGKADKMFRSIFKFFDGSSAAEEIAQSKLSDLKDNAFTAVGIAATASHLKKAGKDRLGFHNNVWRETFNSTSLGKKFISLNDKIHDAPGNAGLLLASKVKDKIFGENPEGEREKARREKNDQYNAQIDGLEERIKQIKDKLNNGGKSLSPQQKNDLEQELRNLEKEKAKTASKQGSYNTRKGIFERARKVLDPDTYLEYEIDEETGDFVLDKKGNRKRRMARSKVIFNSETNTYERIGGVRERFKKSKDKVLGLSDADKQVLKEMTQLLKDGTMGAGAMILGMGALAENPTLGFALLATGTSKTRKFLKVNDNGLKISRSQKRKIAKYMVKENEKKRYTNAQFTSGTILNMDKIVRELTSLDSGVFKTNRILSLIESGNLSSSIPLLGFSLTGTKGALINLLHRLRDASKQHEENVRRYQVSLNVEYAKALTRETIANCEAICRNVTHNVMNKSVQNIYTQQLIQNGSVFLSNESLFVFRNSIINANLTREDKIRQAIMQAALNKGIYNFSRFDLSKKHIMNELLAQLKAKDVITDNDVSTEFFLNQLLDGTSQKTGIKAVLEDLSTNHSDALKIKLFQECVRDFKTANGECDILTRSAKATIESAFRNKLYSNNPDVQIQMEILKLAASTEGNILNVSTSDIMTHLQTSNQSILTTFEANLKAKANGTTVEKEIEAKQKQINALLTDMVLGVLVNHNIADPSNIVLSSNNDSKIQAIKEDLLNLFSFAFKDVENLDISPDVLMEILQSKISSIDKKDIEKAATADVMSRFVSEKCDGDISKLQDAEIRAELEKLTLEKLMDMSESPSEKDEYEKLLELLNGSTNDSDASDSSDKNDMFSTESSDESGKDPNEVADYPLPIVTAKFINNKVFCHFELPNGADEFKIETCKKTSSSSRNNYVFKDEEIIENSNEIACARLVKGDKHGQALVVKYPSDAVKKVAESLGKVVEDAEKKEDKQRTRQQNGAVSRIALEVFDSVKELGEEPTPEEVLGQEQIEALQDVDTEMFIKECEIRRITNTVLDVANLINSRKVDVGREDDKAAVEKMINEALDLADELLEPSFTYQESDDETQEFEQYRKSVDVVVNQLLQMKIIDSDNDKLEIKTFSDKNKAFKKTKTQLRDGIKKMDINQIIEQVKGVS